MGFAAWDLKSSEVKAPVRSSRPESGFRWLLVAAFLLWPVLGAKAQSVPPLTFPAPYPLGVTSGAVSVTVTALQPGTVHRVQVLTQGAAGLDFADAGGACAGRTFSAAGETCSESVTFTPPSPGLRLGAVVLLGSGNTVLGAAYLSGAGLGGLGVFLPGEIVTIAGGNGWKSVQNGPALSAGFYLPTGVALDGAGNLYVADSLHNQIRMVDTNQNVSTVAGTGPATYTGDGSQAANATLYTPSGLALDGAGNLYIADTGNNAIRKILPANGIIVTVAGNGAQGNAGDGGPATAANLNQPFGVTIDTAGNLYIADTGNNRIRRVDAMSGTITNVAGDPGGSGGYSGDNGPAVSALLDGPDTVAFDASGNMYIPDSLNNVVRMVDSSGTIVTFAGGGASPVEYGPASALQLNSPSAVVVDPAQNVYIADTQNNAIRKVFAHSGYFTTVAELGAAGGFFNGATYSQSLYGPQGMVLDGNGNLYFADAFNNVIRAVESSRIDTDFTEALTYLGKSSATQGQYLENDGNAALTITSITPDANAEVDNSVQYACVPNTAYPPVSGCTVGVQFKPIVAANSLQAHIGVATDSINSPFDIELDGRSAAQNSSSVALTSSLNPSVFSENVVFIAMVASVGSSNVPTGTVTFTADGVTVGSATLDATGTASFNLSALAVGNHAVAASYPGDTANEASASSPLSQTVQPIPTQTILGATSSGGANPTALFVATVAGSTGPTPTGTLTFVNGATTMGTTTLDANGAGTLQTRLATGSYAVVAIYSGDTNHAPSSSPAATLSGPADNFALTLTPSTVKLATGQATTLTVNLSSNSSFADTIGLGCGSLPVLVSCHFSSDNTALAAGGVVSVRLSIQTNTPFGDGSSAMNHGRTPAGVAFAGLFLPVSLLFGCLFWRFRRQHAVLFPAALTLLASGMLLIGGCNDVIPGRAAPGTYTLQVTGVGVKTNAMQSQTLSLTITP